jgi:ribonuclease HI
MQRATIYTDGACSGNGTAHARGGWCAIVEIDGTEREVTGGVLDATNQRMEIRAAIEGLRALERPYEVVVCSDSAYVVTCMNERWYDRWRAHGWLGSKRKPVVNRDLWEELLIEVEDRGHLVRFRPVYGHADKLGRALTLDEMYNLRCDKLAVAAVPRLPDRP